MAKKTLFTLALLFILGSNLFSFPWKDFTLSAGASTGYYTGLVREIVYPDPGWENEYLSELLWEIDNVAMLIGNFGISFRGFSLKLTGSTAVNKGTGRMNDYDWLDYTSTSWTNWSDSDIFLDKSFILDVSLDYTFKVSDRFSIPAGIGYKLNYLNWSDTLSKKIYFWGIDKNNNYVQLPSPVIENYEGKISGINYTFVQNIAFLTTGVRYTRKTLTAGLNASFSPYIYAWDLDHHLINKSDGSGTFYLDTFTAHIWYRIKALAECSTGKNGKLTVSLSFEEMPEVRGRLSVYDEDPSDSDKIGTFLGYSPDGAGLASKILSMSIGYTYSFN